MCREASARECRPALPELPVPQHRPDLPAAQKLPDLEMKRYIIQLFNTIYSGKRWEILALLSEIKSKIQVLLMKCEDTATSY